MIVDSKSGVVSIAKVRDPWRAYSALAEDTFTGRGVTPESALAMAAVYGGVSLIAKGCGSMPLEIIDERAAGGPQVVRGGELALRLRNQPNDDMSGAVVWTLVFAHVLLRGNAYLAKIPTDTGGYELYPINPKFVTTYRGDDGAKRFRVRLYEGSTFVDADFGTDAILHILGPSFDDGLQGASFVAVMRNRLGVQLAQSEYQGRFYRDGLTAKGVLTVPGDLTPESAERIKRQWKMANGGMENAHDIAVVHSGATFARVSLTPEDAQFIETMKWGHTEVATALNIPASRLNADGGNGMRYANMAQDDLALYKQAMHPLIVMAEQCINADRTLFGYASPWVPRFNPAGALRADDESRWKVYQAGRATGALSINDIRRAENLPVIGPEGDDYAPVGATGGGDSGDSSAAS